ncbi:MAG: hypothetical protein ACYCUM_03365 [Solirubrobacteraceae bacterium]
MAEVHDMHDAKTHLSRLAERAARGQDRVAPSGTAARSVHLLGCG